MNAPQTTTSLAQTGRRWVMIGIALITIGLSAPSAVADHMGNHERGSVEATATGCGQADHTHDAAPSPTPADEASLQSASVQATTARGLAGRPW